ncbi:MAG: MoaD/ThiS family protein [Planctomycetes bacterium]|nr:MoaD/ThiS family protein [Planctomycetota bacterium]
MIAPVRRTVREKVEALLSRMAKEPGYPTQGKTLFVDLERREVRGGYTPLAVVRRFLEGRGGNMFYLANLLDPSLEPLHPEVPLIFGSGLLTGRVPSAARGNCTSWSPESRVIMDANAGDYFPSFMKLNGIDRLVIYGLPAEWTLLEIRDGAVAFLSAAKYAGMDNIDMREAVEKDFAGRWTKDLAMANITRAGENLVLTSGIMAGPKSLYARGGPGAKMGSLRLKGIVVRRKADRTADGAFPEKVKPMNREIAAQLLDTGVVKSALKVRGTPFLYKPSRLLGAMGTKNNQETTWTDKLDAENLDPFRPGMAGCFACPVNCRPLNDLKAEGKGDRYDAGDGPEYVTLGKFGPNIGVEDPRLVLRFNNICNDLGFDTASMGSAIAWAMELFQRGIIGKERTGGLDLSWGNAEAIEKALFLTAKREGFGDVLADSAAAVRTGKYPAEALKYRMAVKNLMQSDPHDSRILKAFALGLAVATRGMDHLRNRVTLEINAKINDDPAYKESLYGAPVSGKPNSYEGKEYAVRRCENVFAVGDSIGMCRFTTKLFNSPNLPGYEQFVPQLVNVTGLEFTPEELDAVGLDIMGIERLINGALGCTRADDTLPPRWFEEEIRVGKFRGEKVDRAEFEAMLDRFYRLSRLDREGQPVPEWKLELTRTVKGFGVLVKIPPGACGAEGRTVVVETPVATTGELVEALDGMIPGIGERLKSSVYNFAINREIALHGRDTQPVKDGDEVEVMPMFAGGTDGA